MIDWTCKLCNEKNSVGCEECQHCHRKRSQRRILAHTPVSSIPLAKTTPKAKQVGRKVHFDGYKFDSKVEYERYLCLKQYQADKIINGLNVHPKWLLLPRVVLKPNALRSKQSIQRAINYSADFEYYYQGLHVVEDVKGAYGNSKNNRRLKRVGKAMITPAARLRHKMLQAKLPNMVFLIVTIPTMVLESLATKEKAA